MAQSNTTLTPELIAEAVKRVMAGLGENPQPPSAAAATPAESSAALKAATDYPLGAKRPDLVRSATGKGLDDITLDQVMNDRLGFDDVRIRPETLEYQAQIAENVGRPRLAANLRRAAEMTRIPDERLLEMYNSLRPYRSTKAELLAMADELDSKYQAPVCAAMVREAAQVYENRGRLKK